MEHFSDENIGMSEDLRKKPRIAFGKTLDNYEELAEGLDHIEKQLSGIETRILGRPEPTDMSTLNKNPDGDRSEPGYIERFDDIAIRIRSSVSVLSNIAQRLNDAI